MPAMHGDLGVKAAKRSAAQALVQRRRHAQRCRRQQAPEQAVPKGFTWIARTRIAHARIAIPWVAIVWITIAWITIAREPRRSRSAAARQEVARTLQGGEAPSEAGRVTGSWKPPMQHQLPAGNTNGEGAIEAQSEQCGCPSQCPRCPGSAAGEPQRPSWPRRWVGLGCNVIRGWSR